MKLIDLSVAIEDGLPVDPPPQIAHIDYIDHKAGIESMLSFFLVLHKRIFSMVAVGL